MLLAHYDLSTGQIVQISERARPFQRAGLGVAIVTDRAVLNGPHRVRMETVQTGEFGWDYAAVELYTPPLTVADVKARRNIELVATDGMMTEDRPTDKDAWRAYRAALRGLGLLSTAAEMIAAWPVRPDGADAIADIR